MKPGSGGGREDNLVKREGRSCARAGDDGGNRSTKAGAGDVFLRET